MKSNKKITRITSHCLITITFAVVWHDDYLHPPSRVSTEPSGRLLALETHSKGSGAAHDALPSWAKSNSPLLSPITAQLHREHSRESSSCHRVLIFPVSAKTGVSTFHLIHELCSTHPSTALSPGRTSSGPCPKLQYRRLRTDTSTTSFSSLTSAPVRVQ